MNTIADDNVHETILCTVMVAEGVVRPGDVRDATVWEPLAPLAPPMVWPLAPLEAAEVVAPGGPLVLEGSVWPFEPTAGDGFV